jgi:hypothetical protein
MADSTGEAGAEQTPDPIPGWIEGERARARGRDPYTPQAEPTGGGFAFTPEQIEHQLRGCAELLRHYEHARYTALNSAAALHPPAPDEPGSVLQADATRQCLLDLADAAHDHLTYLTAWWHTLDDVKNAYLRSEHLTETQWQRLAGG